MLAKRTTTSALATVLLAGALPIAVAHGGGGSHGGEAMAMSKPVNPNSTTAIAHAMESYWQHPHHFSWNTAHTVLMIVAWVFAMPLAIMLSIGRSRYHLPAQVVFHALNGLGLFAGFVYNHSTPDLYVGNSHHPLGWAVFGFAVLWTLLSLYVAYGEYQSSRNSLLDNSHAVTASRMAQHNSFHRYNDDTPPRHSRDSGQGTERNSASLFGSRQNSSEELYFKPEEEPLEDLNLQEEEKEFDSERRGFLGDNRVDRFLSRGAQRFSSRRAAKVTRFAQIILEKHLLLLGFAAITSGFIVSGGLFRSRLIFSGLAHYIKGGIFFWYGLLTLGRWMGAFTEFGWAWNVRPRHSLVAKWKSLVPSAEFTESFVIWLYGASNVFLEHLNNWGDKWTPADLEHLSITILFFGGGLLGMLFESRRLRELMNTPVALQMSKDVEYAGASHYVSAEDSDQRWEEPATYRVPLNPMPALTIMLLGMMMGAHHQSSMVSTMMHAQWGSLFTAFALARGMTYIILYLKPPTSHFPSRPPSEIVAAFCLTSGGLLFMNSASDVVWAIESNGLDAMTIFTVTMGLTGIIMAWELVVFAIKGWAVRKERAATGKPLA